MQAFHQFLEELEVNILKENLHHVACVTGVNRRTLVRCFRENETVPQLSTLYKLMVFLDWKFNIKGSNLNLSSFDIEDLVRETFKTVDYTILKNRADIHMLNNFVKGTSKCSLYKIYTILPKLGLTLEVIKPNYQLDSKSINYAIYG